MFRLVRRSCYPWVLPDVLGFTARGRGGAKGKEGGGALDSLLPIPSEETQHGGLGTVADALGYREKQGDRESTAHRANQERKLRGRERTRHVGYFGGHLGCLKSGVAKGCDLLPVSKLAVSAGSFQSPQTPLPNPPRTLDSWGVESGDRGWGRVREKNKHAIVNKGIIEDCTP